MGTLVVEIFEKQLDFKGAIRVPGKDVEPPPRPWTRLREDPNLNTFVGASLEELHQRNLKAWEAKQREDAVRKRVGRAVRGLSRNPGEAAAEPHLVQPLQTSPDAEDDKMMSTRDLAAETSDHRVVLRAQRVDPGVVHRLRSTTR